MELEFDKEIDAILRRARAPVGAAVIAPLLAHIDGDAIAAFAENALPAKARSVYMEHFADCDGCRKLLSNVILANTEAVAATASSSALAPVAEAVVPWYIKIFRTPNLALAMGALVLTFGGLLGFLVFQNRSNSGAMLSQTKEPERTNGGPHTSGVPAANSANAMASAANAPANIASPSSVNAPMPAPATKSSTGPSDDTLDHNGSATGSGQSDMDRRVATDGVTLEAAKPVAAAPPPPPVDQPKLAIRDEKKAGEVRLKDAVAGKEITLSKTDTYDRSRESPQAARKNSGPSRASVQNNTQQEMNTQQNAAGMVAPTRSAGGRTFVNHDGAWYDKAYHGQATINVGRGTDAYNKLDGGLRKIADSIGGTVVVVWKSKAYRIQ